MRVAQCYTGGVGKRVINLLTDHPELTLAAVLVHDQAKDGVDAGLLAGAGPIGVRATTKIDDIIEAAPDCAIWAGTGWLPEELSRLLRAGINVYTALGAWYLPGSPDYPALNNACLEGGATLVGGGTIPGFVSDVLPLFLSGYVGRVRQIRARQANLLADYPSAAPLRAGLGFGGPVTQPPPGEVSPVDQRWLEFIGQSARMVATALGFDFGSVRLTGKQFAAADRDLILANGLEIPAGTAAGVRWEFTGYTTSAEPFYQLTKEQVAAVGLGPSWRASADAPLWRVEIDGAPSLVCEVSTVSDGGFGEATAEANAARAVNLIPQIVAAAPGCLSLLDIPAPTGFST
jgi:hypothetical protein